MVNGAALTRSQASHAHDWQMPHVPRPATPALPAPIGSGLIVGLAAAAMLAALLPGGRWADALALLASGAALFAAHERRTRDMIVAAGIGAALAPSGLLLAPLCLGLTIGRRGARHLPLAALAATITTVATPWAPPVPTLPNLAYAASAPASAASAWPGVHALVVAIGIGAGAWLCARASILRPRALFAEARLGAALLAALLPLPVGLAGVVLLIAFVGVPGRAPLPPANDNVAFHRRTIRLAA